MRKRAGKSEMTIKAEEKHGAVKETETKLKSIMCLIQQKHAQEVVVADHERRLKADENFRKWAAEFVNDIQGNLAGLSEHSPTISWIQTARSTAAKTKGSAKAFLEKFGGDAQVILDGLLANLSGTMKAVETKNNEIDRMERARQDPKQTVVTRKRARKS